MGAPTRFLRRRRLVGRHASSRDTEPRLVAHARLLVIHCPAVVIDEEAGERGVCSGVLAQRVIFSGEGRVVDTLTCPRCGAVSRVDMRGDRIVSRAVVDPGWSDEEVDL